MALEPSGSKFSPSFKQLALLRSEDFTLRMFGNRFLDEAGPSYETQLSEDEDRDEEICTDMEFPQIDDTEELAQGLEECTLSSTHFSTGGRRLNWWKHLKEFHPSADASKHTSWWSKRSSRQKKNPVCDICEEQILSGWFKCSYWGQIYCKKHTSDGTPCCCSCPRLEMGDMKYTTLNDGRKLCSDCRYTAVMDPQDCKALLEQVLRFFKGLNMKIRYYIPVMLVDEEEMIKITKEKDVLGITFYELLDAVTYVSRSIQRAEKVEVVKEVEHLVPGRKVRCILLLYGFPKLYMGATLAHEMMHAWMKVQGYKRESLSKNIKEGICEVIGHKWLEWQSFTGDDFMNGISENVPFLRNLKEHLKYDKEERLSEAYGHGFREAKWAVERYGLRYTMKHIDKTGKLPE